LKGSLIAIFFFRHEHLYLKKSLAQNVIRSDAFSAKTTKEVLGNAKVILCTLSMLSSQRMLSAKFTSYIPVNTLVVDEASQIQIQDYFPVFAKLKTIHKVCFIGDDKQCMFFFLGGKLAQV